jgi:hypothetical protein
MHLGTAERPNQWRLCVDSCGKGVLVVCGCYVLLTTFMYLYYNQSQVRLEDK